MAVTSQTLQDGPKNVVMHFTNDGGGTPDESASAVTKVDVSALSPVPARVAIRQIKWSVTGAVDNDLQILWAADTDEVAWVMATGESGTHDFCDIGNLQNTEATGFSGDINFLTSVAGVAYSVTLWMEKKGVET